MERFSPFSLSPSLASTEPRCRDSRFSTFAPDQPPYLPVRRARVLRARRSRHREPSRGGRFRRAAHPWPARSTLAGRGHARRERVAATGSTRPPLGGSAPSRRLCRSRRRRGGRKTSARPKWLPRSGPILALLGFSARSRRASRQKTSQGKPSPISVSFFWVRSDMDRDRFGSLVKRGFQTGIWSSSVFFFTRK